jgi:hypothetical protein
MRNSFVQQIEPAKDAMRMEDVVELFRAAFERVCGLNVVDRLCFSPKLWLFLAKRGFSLLCTVFFSL